MNTKSSMGDVGDGNPETNPPAPSAPSDPSHASHSIPSPEPPSSPRPFGLRRRRRTGKVARLPREFLNLVNQSLRDGLTYAAVSARLEVQGFPDLSVSNIGQWARGGYREWLKEQVRFEKSQEPSPALQAILGQLQPDGRALANMNEIMISAQLNELLRQLDTASLKEMLADQPREYFRLIAAFSQHSQACTRRQLLEQVRLKNQLETRQQEKEADSSSKGGVSKEVFDLVEQELKLL